MKIGICDDDLQDREALKAILLTKLCEHETLECCESGVALLESHYRRPFDILFLDIKMPHLDGIETAKELRRSSQSTRIIFITQYRDYAAESYAVKAFSYLIKPIVTEKVLDVWEQARRSRLTAGKSLPVLTNYGTVYVRYMDIVYADTLRHKLSLHTYQGTLETRMPMQDLAKELDQYGFYRIHNSYLINLNCILAVHNKLIIMDGGIQIPIGKTKRIGEVKAAILSWRETRL